MNWTVSRRGISIEHNWCNVIVIDASKVTIYTKEFGLDGGIIRYPYTDFRKTKRDLEELVHDWTDLYKGD